MNLRPHQIRAINAMWDNQKGQIIVPTGGGKTMCMIEDVAFTLEAKQRGQTIVIVAPRILLAEQLCEEFLEVFDTTHTHVMHVHSGKTSYYGTTKPDKIHLFANTARTAGENCIIFTTYHSLHRLVEADIEVNNIYFDEAHNSVAKNFHIATKHFATLNHIRCFFFTATPKHSLTPKKAGMNDFDVYGKVICQVPAPELVDGGYILAPKVNVRQLPISKDRNNWQRDADYLFETIKEDKKDQVLVCARTTKQIINVIQNTDFVESIKKIGYSWLVITSKTGAIIDGHKVTREEFFNTLNSWGKDPSKKFIVLHHSILSEGINVNGLQSVIFLRNMDYVGISQTIGRVIRLGGETKTYGLVTIPTYDNVGISTARKVQAVVDVIFNKGEAAISEITR